MQSKYPNLIAELIQRGWSDNEIRGLTSGTSLFFAALECTADEVPHTGNILRILDKVEAVAHAQRHLLPSYEVFEGRKDLVKHDKPPGQ